MDEVEHSEQLANLKALVQINEEIVKRMKLALEDLRSAMEKFERGHSGNLGDRLAQSLTAEASFARKANSLEISERL